MIPINGAHDMFKTHTTSGPIATHSHVSPIPSVVPDVPEYQKATAEGYRTLWVGFVLMVIVSLVFTGLSWRVPVPRRLFHILTTLVTIISAIAYYAMATGHATTFQHLVFRSKHEHVPDTYHHVFRQIFWARYLEWALTVPLLLLQLTFLAGMSGAHILITLSANLIMIFVAFFSRFGRAESPQQWGWLVIALLAYFTILYQLAVNGRRAANARSQKVGSFWLGLTGYLVVVLTAYPIIWAVVVGGKHLTVNKETIAYLVLDVLSKAGFGAWLLISYSRIAETNLELGGIWTFGLGGNPEGRLRLDDDGA